MQFRFGAGDGFLVNRKRNTDNAWSAVVKRFLKNHQMLPGIKRLLQGKALAD